MEGWCPQEKSFCWGGGGGGGGLGGRGYGTFMELQLIKIH